MHVIWTEAVNDFYIENHDDYDRSYPSSLWPYILYRIMNKMKLPKQQIHSYRANANIRYTYRNDVWRASVAYYMMIHGAAMDICLSDNDDGM